MTKVKIRLLVLKLKFGNVSFFYFIELSALGIYPQFNKQAFVRDVLDIINKDLNMVSSYNY
jgi:hypothetical protein